MLRTLMIAAVAVVTLPAVALAQYSATWSNNCGSKTRCVRVYNGIEDINFCLNPGQSHTVYGLQQGAAYCAWCSSSRLPPDCQRFVVEFN